jgi:hypothetical protein
MSASSDQVLFIRDHIRFSWIKHNFERLTFKRGVDSVTLTFEGKDYSGPDLGRAIDSAIDQVETLPAA